MLLCELVTEHLGVRIGQQHDPVLLIAEGNVDADGVRFAFSLLNAEFLRAAAGAHILDQTLAHFLLHLRLRVRGHHLASALVTQNSGCESELIWIFRVFNCVTVSVKLTPLILLSLLVQLFALVCTRSLLATRARLVNLGHEIQISKLLLIVPFLEASQLFFPLLNLFSLVQKVVGELCRIAGHICS